MAFLRRVTDPTMEPTMIMSHSTPEATTFTNSTTEIAMYYLKNNPWKLSDANNVQKVYRFCIICGDERFSSEEWSKVIDFWGAPASCNKEPCLAALAFVPGFVPRRHFMIETDLDKGRVPLAKETEFFEEIGEVTSLIRFDKVYRSDEQIPAEYFDVLKKLEGFPVETRTSEIDTIYFDYQEQNNIEVGDCFTDTSDPFLKTLALYRIESVKLLNLFRPK